MSFKKEKRYAKICLKNSMTLRFKGDGSWLPRGWYLEDSTGGATLAQSVSPLFPHKQGLWYQRSLLLLQFFFHDNRSKQYNNWKAVCLVVKYVAWKSDCLGWNVAWDHITSSTLSNLVKLWFHLWKMGDSGAYLDEFLQGIKWVS